jgi:hypothetical protein
MPPTASAKVASELRSEVFARRSVHLECVAVHGISPNATAKCCHSRTLRNKRIKMDDAFLYGAFI